MKFNKVGNIFNKRGIWQQICKIYLRDLTMLQDAKILVEISEWSQIFLINLPNADHKFTDCVISKWCDKTHIFHFPVVELGIKPFDFTFLTGML